MWFSPLGSRYPDRVRDALGGMSVKERDQRKSQQVFRLWGGRDLCERIGGRKEAWVGRDSGRGASLRKSQPDQRGSKIPNG